MSVAPILAQLTQAFASPVSEQHPLAGECTFRLGGPARFFVAPTTPEGLRTGRQAVRDLGLRCFLLGGGANVLFQEAGFDGVVVSTRGLNTLEVLPDGRVRTGAGAMNGDLTQLTRERGLTGFEWAAGLPGTLGGGVYMNAKCYGGVFSDLVERVTALTPAGEWVELDPAQCGFAYKRSAFQSNGHWITSVLLKLRPGDPAAVQKQGAANQADRERKGQFTFPSAGCVFKNAYDINTPAGRLIEACGLKGQTRGGAQVYERHANFIVNTGMARPAEVLELIALIKQRVWEQQHYRLEEELVVVPATGDSNKLV